MRNILRKVLYFKIKEIILQNNEAYEKQNTKPNKQKQNHKLKFLATNQTKVV